MNLKLICLKLRAKIDLRNEPIISIGDQKNAEKMFFRAYIRCNSEWGLSKLMKTNTIFFFKRDILK